MRGIDERSTERTLDLGWGTAFFNDTLKHIWDLNFVEVHPDPDVEPGEIFDEVERVQDEAGLKHRKVMVQDEATGTRLAGAVPDGWSATPVVLMIKRRPPDRAIDTSLAKERTWDEIRPFIEKVHRESSIGKDPATVDEILAFHDITQRSVHTRYIAADVDGEIVADCELYSDGEVAQIEDVSTLVDFRGRGLARSVVHHATELALSEGHDLVFLVADADDWPRELYVKLGYDPIGTGYEFLKKPY